MQSKSTKRSRYRCLITYLHHDCNSTLMILSDYHFQSHLSLMPRKVVWSLVYVAGCSQIPLRMTSRTGNTILVNMYWLCLPSAAVVWEHNWLTYWGSQYLNCKVTREIIWLFMFYKLHISILPVWVFPSHCLNRTGALEHGIGLSIVSVYVSI